MELWTITYKLILLLFVAAGSYESLSASYMFGLLLYFCLNLAMHIVKNSGLRQMFALLALLLIIACVRGVDPLFILLMPIAVYELASCYTAKYPLLLVLMLAPLPFAADGVMLLYGFVAAASLTFLAMLASYSGRIERLNERNEKLRADMHRMNKSLNESNEYIRQSEYTFKLEERNRLSQEIHDEIGHSMTGALIQMEAAKRLIETDAAKAAELMQNAIMISKDGIESIRQVLKNIKPPAEQLGIHRLKLMIDEFAAKHDIETGLEQSGDVEAITPLQWRMIQENIKEALTNTLKYAEATAVRIEVQVLNKMIAVKVSDNGKGASKVVKGLGIAGMEERAAAVNGTVVVDGTKGFSIAMLIPRHAE